MENKNTTSQESRGAILHLLIGETCPEPLICPDVGPSVSKMWEIGLPDQQTSLVVQVWLRKSPDKEGIPDSAFQAVVTGFLRLYQQRLVDWVRAITEVAEAIPGSRLSNNISLKELKTQDFILAFATETDGIVKYDKIHILVRESGYRYWNELKCTFMIEAEGMVPMLWKELCEMVEEIDTNYANRNSPNED